MEIAQFKDAPHPSFPSLNLVLGVSFSLLNSCCLCVSIPEHKLLSSDNVMDKVQLNHKQSLEGGGIFSNIQKKDLGVQAVIGAGKLVRLQKGSGC